MVLVFCYQAEGWGTTVSWGGQHFIGLNTAQLWCSHALARAEQVPQHVIKRHFTAGSKPATMFMVFGGYLNETNLAGCRFAPLRFGWFWPNRVGYGHGNDYGLDGSGDPEYSRFAEES